MNPQFEHDCRSCTFLGFVTRGDAWYCGDKSIIIRHSNIADDYSSIPVVVVRRHASELPEHFREALQLLNEYEQLRY